MKVVSVASGKGGTGKTTVSVMLAEVAGDVFFIDADVEEPNANLFIGAEIFSVEPVSMRIPEIDFNRCSGCGLCAKSCRFNAITLLAKKPVVFSDLCHGCGLCSYVCPNGAILEKDEVLGYISCGQKGSIDFCEGRLNVGKAITPPIIKRLKEKIAKDTIIDSPPGTTCPVVVAVSESDFVILVTEPTPFGLHDLKLAVEVVKKLGLNYGVVINKSCENDSLIETFCEAEDIEILLKIPHSIKAAEAYSNGEGLFDVFPFLKDSFLKLRMRLFK